VSSDPNSVSESPTAFWCKAWRKGEAERRAKVLSRAFGVLVPILALVIVALASDQATYFQKLREALPVGVVAAALYWLGYSIMGLWIAPRLLLLDVAKQAKEESDRHHSDALNETRRQSEKLLRDCREEVLSRQEDAKHLVRERDRLEAELRTIRQPTLSDLAEEANQRTAKIYDRKATAFQVLEWIHFESPQQRKGYYRELAHRTLSVPPPDHKVINERLALIFEYLHDRGLVAWQDDPSYPGNEYIRTTPKGSELVRFVRKEHQ
jgi:hypothetical protein